MNGIINNQRNSIFLTLTYDNNHIPYNYSLNRRYVQLYLKRLRKTGLKFKYLCAGEYGFKLNMEALIYQFNYFWNT